MESQATEGTESLLDDVAAGAIIAVPSLWIFEVTNALVVLLRRKRMSQEQWTKARRSVALLSPEIDDLVPGTVLGTVSELAAKQRLTVYDAASLELAIRRRLPLATRDVDLSRAAKSCGVDTLL